MKYISYHKHRICWKNNNYKQFVRTAAIRVYHWLRNNNVKSSDYNEIGDFVFILGSQPNKSLANYLAD